MCQCVEIMAHSQSDLSFSQRVDDTVIRVGEGDPTVRRLCSRTEVKERKKTQRVALPFI